MHPQLEHLAHQAHVDDLRRDAEQHRRAARLARRQARAAAAAPVAAPVLSPTVHEVLVFAERRPTRGQLAQLLDQLSGLHDDVVTAVLHHRPATTPALSDEAGSHSLTLPASPAMIPAQRTPPEAEQHLDQVVGALRAAGHETTGELVAGSMSRVLLAQVRERRPQAVFLLTDRHRLAHLAHVDLERRLRHRTDARVVTVVDHESLQPV